MSGEAPNKATRMSIGRWCNTYFVGSDAIGRQASMRDVIDRIGRSIAEELPACCEWRLQQAQANSSPEVWRIRELDLDFIVDVSGSAASNVAQAWSCRLVDGIHQITERGLESEGVLRFPNRAAYLAKFVADLAAGRAKSKWFYEEFQSLHQFPTGKAIVEALARNPADGVETLLLLARSGNLERILVTLTDSDARMLCEACFDGPLEGRENSGYSRGVGTDLGRLASSAEFSGSAAELSQWSGRLLEMWSHQPLRATRLETTDYRDALRWIAKAALNYPGAERDPAAIAAVNGLLLLRRLVTALGSELVADRLVRDLAGERVSLDEAVAVARAEGAGSPEAAIRFLARIARGDPDWAAQAAAVLLRNRRPAAVASEGESTITPSAGAFLIAPALVDLHLKEVAEAAAGDGEGCGEAAAFFRHAVLTKCLGGSLALQCASDPALCLLSGIRSLRGQERPIFAAVDLAWANSLFVRHLVEETGCEGRCLLPEAVGVPGHTGEVLLVRDLARNAWLFACSCPQELGDREHALISAIDSVRRSVGSSPYVFLRGSLAAFANSRAMQERVGGLVALDHNEISPKTIGVLSHFGCVSNSTPREKIARLLSPPDDEFEYFSTAAPGEQFDTVFDLLTTLISRAAVRTFARHLIGFQSASPQHLFHNFLEGIGTVHNHPERIEVELPHTPLSLVLQLSGLDRQSYTLPWLEGREICLLPVRE
jgi:hypothetical protein